MEKIFADAEDKYVRSAILFGNKADKYLYTDAEFTTKLTKDELFEICSKGALVSYDGAYYRPLTFAHDSTQPCTTVTIVTLDESGVTPTYVVLNSKEFTG